MKFDNYMILDFPSKSTNEAFARSAVACFAAQMDPTLEELGDIRTAVSEAVTNCIVHAYPEKIGNITLRCRILKDNVLCYDRHIRGIYEATLVYKTPVADIACFVHCFDAHRSQWHLGLKFGFLLNEDSF